MAESSGRLDEPATADGAARARARADPAAGGAAAVRRAGGRPAPRRVISTPPRASHGRARSSAASWWRWRRWAPTWSPPGRRRWPDTRYAVATHDLAPGTTLGPADVGLVALDLPTDQATGTFSDTRLGAGRRAAGPGPGRLAAHRRPRRAAAVRPRRSRTVRADPGDVRRCRRRVPATGRPPTGRCRWRCRPPTRVDGSLRPGDRVDVVATEGTPASCSSTGRWSSPRAAATGAPRWAAATSG